MGNFALEKSGKNQVCDECNREWEGDCPEHGPLLLLADAPVPPSAAHSEERAVLTAPPELSVAASGIPQGGRGIRKGGRVDHYVDAGDTRVANWMRFVNCARHEQEQNVVAFQFRGAIFYRSVRALAAHEELLVWYGDAFALQLGISPKDFRAPLLRPLPREAFPCPHCSLSFTSPLYLEAHTRRCRWRFTTRNVGVGVNRSVNLPFASNFASGEPYRSEECGTALKNLGDHTSLKRSRSGQLSYRCEGSGAVSTNSDTLTKHKRIHSGERPFRCEECGAAFTQTSNLTKHKRTHSGERPFRCEECGAAFTQLAHLTTHKRTHSGERPFRCEQCGAAFTESGTLTKHKRTHSGERPFRCEECGAAFTQTSTLTIHKRTHSGERPFRCEKCGAAFTQTSTLTIHKRTHSGERPYRCEQCGAAFTQLAHLTTHKRTHSGERPFRCEECGAAFARHGTLTVHKRTHSRERRCNCEECGAAFASSIDLTRHKRTHLGNNLICNDVRKTIINVLSEVKRSGNHSEE
ncbi:Krueppel homolog 1 [Gryllus bimaculatus]|nr:Krueppel homolog 1 [Gryllus bimaculatus]